MSFVTLFRRSAGIYAVNAIIIICAGILAFLLRYEFSLPEFALASMSWAIPLWLIAKSGIFHCFALDRRGWHYVSTPDLVRLGVANVVASFLAVPFIVFLAPAGFLRSVYLLDLFLCTFGTAVARIMARLICSYGKRSPLPRKRIVIYGAGDSGVRLLSEIRNNPQLGYDVRGFVDDDPEKAGQILLGAAVLGGGADLAALNAKHKLEEVLIAMASASGASMTAVLRSCHDAGLHCRTIPSLAEVIESQALSHQIRDVAVEDLLGRKPVRLDDDAIRAKLENKVVMVTGAAGSIGSELCRQVGRFGPRAIIGYEIAETPLFEIDREMRQLFPKVEFRPEIGSIQNRARLDEVFATHRPSVVYHAAAYKHVPLMEAHFFEAVENNVLGTENVAVAAAEHGVTDFVMISSDKAVRPTNVMGATKRMAELLVTALQCGGGRPGMTKYVSVRFGNVLGSNGSVVPVFKKQIASGGPVTITHPDMKRYFMTIPEAVQLVLQASTMSEGGEIFVLDMGAPVRIVDLATNLILLSGLRPEEDIQLKFTGIRPGEKLYEELASVDENTLATFHEKIMIYSGPVHARKDIELQLLAIRRYCMERDARRLFLELKKAVPEYNPSGDILQWLMRPEPALELPVPIANSLARGAIA